MANIWLVLWDYKNKNMFIIKQNKTIMRFVAKFICLLFTIVFVSASSPYLKQTPGCTQARRDEIDQLIARNTFIGAGGYEFPVDESKLKPFCRERWNDIFLIEYFFQQCYNKEVWPYGNLIVNSFRKQNRKLCSNTNLRANKIQTLRKAFPASKRIAGNSTCMEQFVADVRPLLDYEENNKKMHNICVNYLKAYRCSREYSNRFVAGDKSPAGDMLFDLHYFQIQSNLQILCADYLDGTAPRCGSLNKAKRIVHKPAYDENVYRTPVLLIVDLLQSMHPF